MFKAIEWTLIVLLAGGASMAAEEGKPPGKLVFPSKQGDVSFDHPAHLARAKGDCTICHEKLWPQSAKVPLSSSSGCAACHTAGGKSFDMKRNCDKCHPVAGAKTEARSPAGMWCA